MQVRYQLRHSPEYPGSLTQRVASGKIPRTAGACGPVARGSRHACAPRRDSARGGGLASGSAFPDGGVPVVRFLPFVFELALLVFCVIDIIQTPEFATRNLPKWGWLILVIILPLIGGRGVAGRWTPRAGANPTDVGSGRGVPRVRQAGRRHERHRSGPGRRAQPGRSRVRGEPAPKPRPAGRPRGTAARPGGRARPSGPGGWSLGITATLGEPSARPVSQSARARLLRGLCSSSMRPRCSSSGGTYMPNRPR